MQKLKAIIGCRPSKRRLKEQAIALAAALLCAASAGCTAVTNPIADGIPVRLLPPEIVGPSKACYQTIPLNLLRQTPPDAYRLDAGDVLGVFIEGYLGEKNVLLPVQVAPLVQIPGQNRLPPGAGYPVPVQEDGKIALPAFPKLSVKGMTVGEARDAIRNLYKDKIDNNERFLVTLLHQRQQQVLVFRQEAQQFLAGQDGPIPISKRNTGHLVDLPAYQNDVLNALARSGGLPELDAYNEIIICREGMRDRQPKLDVMKQVEKAKPGSDPSQFGVWTGDTLRIPLRLPPGAPLPFGPEDIVLHTGDVLFLEARDEQAFFTAGLLPPGKHMIPRDHDLDVIEAIALVRGPLYNGAGLRWQQSRGDSDRAGAGESVAELVRGVAACAGARPGADRGRSARGPAAPAGAAGDPAGRHARPARKAGRSAGPLHDAIVLQLRPVPERAELQERRRHHRYRWAGSAGGTRGADHVAVILTEDLSANFRRKPGEFDRCLTPPGLRLIFWHEL